MYIPKHHEETDVAVLHSLIEAHPLGAWVVHAEDGLRANHIPFLLDRSRGEFGTLVAHVARGNDVWKLFAEPLNCLVIFQGNESYISPSWYPSKHTDGKAVPTWNYAVVHAHGKPRVIHDAAWLLGHLNQMTDTHESQQALPWKVSDAPAEYVERLVGAIVGIEIPIEKLLGKWKVSHNRTLSDRLGVKGGLLGRGDARAQAMAKMISTD